MKETEEEAERERGATQSTPLSPALDQSPAVISALGSLLPDSFTRNCSVSHMS